MIARRIIKAINWLLFFLIVATPLFYWKWSLYPYAVPKTVLFEAIVELIFALWVVLAVSDKRYRPRMTPLAWAIVVYLGILTITAFTGVDPWRSFFSDIERAFGVVAYYHLAALTLVLSSLSLEISWKKLWFASFGVSLATVGIAFFQLASPNILLANDAAAGRPGATFGNPTFLAGYLLFNIFLAAYFLGRTMDDKRRGSGETFFLWAVVILDIAGVFITETRGDILGLFAGIFILVALFAIRPPTPLAPRASAATGRTLFSRRDFYVLLLAILLIAGGGIWFSRGLAVWNGVPGIDRLKDLTFSGTNSDIVPREIALAAAWQGFLARPFAGWGFENFNVVFNSYYNPKILEYGAAESDFDKPHNIILEELDAGGVLLLLAYLATLTTAAYEAWKLKDGLAGQFVIAALAAYLVRSAVIFDTIGPALMLYLLFGWIDGMYRLPGLGDAGASREIRKDQKNASDVNKAVLVVVLMVALVAIYVLNGTALAASSSAWEGHEDIQLAGDPADGVVALQAEAATWNVYQWDFFRDSASTVAQAYFDEPAVIPTSTVVGAIAEMNQVVAGHPNDAYNHYLLAEIYNFTYEIDPQSYLAGATVQEQAALQLSPDRQQIYYDIAKTKSLEGDLPGALAAMKQALDLDPNVADSHFYYGILALASGDSATGYAEIETAHTLDPHDAEIASEWQSLNAITQ